ncbi:hypothetical protein NIES2109_10060 [Nostoc sp. HK-01]|uniref:Uncharacterized protein n=1 Tax=Anabaenopsis circularis NIES-21 TaxID=1085406 RepID=A0A1Z4GLQ7_9CYAN|nr:hypothetical protein NIES21_42810 [Anabaenopsis circularis NIES-21]BBD58234.1 hypothetical protein NIES2109_10060 [Nostoc sp. HK-01]
MSLIEFVTLPYGENLRDILTSQCRVTGRG